MLATAATASAPTTATAHHPSARRPSSSTLICAICASAASLRAVTATCSSTTASIAAGTYRLPVAPAAVERQVQVRAVQLAAPAATAAARAAPPLTHQRARQRRLWVLDRGRQPPPPRAQLTIAGLTQVAKVIHEPVPVSRTGSLILPEPPRSRRRPRPARPAPRPFSGVADGAGARSVASSVTPIVPSGPPSHTYRRPAGSRRSIKIASRWPRSG